MPKIKLTEKVIPRLKGRPADSKSREPVIYWDLAMPGFGVQVSSKKVGSRTYVAQRDLPNGKTRRVPIGRVGTEIKTLDEARAKAGDMLHAMRHGHDPKAARGVPTLEVLARAYVDAHVNLAPRSVAGYRRTLDAYLSDWKDLRLTEITSAMVETRHRKLGEQYGEATANVTMRALRAWFNEAVEKYPEVSSNPVRLKRKWFDIPSRERHVRPDQLPAFYKAVLALENPVARDYILTLLFTGLRREEAAGLAWTDLDFTNGVIMLPASRTKARRALSLPMSDFVHALLIERSKLGNARWIFPANSESGHISEPKQPLGLVAEATGIVISAHDLRRTFSKAAINAGVHTIHLKAMLNHSLGKKRDTTVDYTVQNESDLREPMQRATDVLKKWCGIA